MSTELTRQAEDMSSANAGWLRRTLQSLVLQRLARVQHGRLHVVQGKHRRSYGSIDDVCNLDVTIEVLDPDFFVEVALGGSVGGAEAYMQKFWNCDDLTALVRLLIRNRHVLDAMETGFARFKAPLRRYAHWQRRNHRHNSRKNIEAHYDLGNDFFELFLDPTMMYSSGIFPQPGASLESASIAKLDRICRKLNLQPSDHVVEIGTGWGGFALHAAGHYGCHVTTTTISSEQHDLASRRIRQAGLADRVTVLKRDYRDLDGQFDKLVSIEMVEAVGHQFFDTFFSKCSSLLKADGEMLLQSITIADQQYEKSKRSVDFIQKYIFPGGALPSLGAISDCISRVTDLRIVDLLDIGPHYAETLRHWRRAFMSRLSEVRKMGFPDEFIRMWEYYLCYCEAGFDERVIGDLQVHFQKPLCKAGGVAQA